MLRIITDSSAEFDENEAEALGIRIVPLTVIFGSEAYREGVDLKKDVFYQRLIAGEMPHTSLPSTEEFQAAFAESTEPTIVILIASELSGTVNSARLAVQEGGFSNVLVYDSRCTTCMLRLLVEEACRHREKSPQEVAAILDELRPRLRLLAYLDTLEYLYKGGRIKKSVAIVGEVLGIKPLVTIAESGAVVMAGKAHGRKKALKVLVDTLNAAKVDPDYPVYYLQTNAEEYARSVMAQTGREDAALCRINCAVGAHIGPDAAGFVYVEKK